MTKPDLRAAIVDLAKAKAEPGKPVNLYAIGPTLIVEMGFSQDEIVNALYAMEAEGIIEMPGNNTIVVLQR